MNSLVERNTLGIDERVTVMRPPGPGMRIEWRELWEYRDLLYFLAWRDVKVRYKQTLLGATWAVIQPIFSMLIFTLFFGRLAHMPSDGVPYPLFVFAALLPWQFFSYALTNASTSLVVNERMISKVYFPRMLVPLASVLAGLVDFAVGFVLLILLMLFYGHVPTGMVVMLPLFLFVAVATAFGVSLWLSALDVQFRDVRYTIPFLTQLWMFATPVVYPTTLLPERYRPLLGLNPMAGVVEGFRWSLLRTSYHPGAQLAVSLLVALIVLATGAMYFRKMEAQFADVI